MKSLIVTVLLLISATVQAASGYHIVNKLQLGVKVVGIT
jgi:hypothetical protein